MKKFIIFGPLSAALHRTPSGQSMPFWIPAHRHRAHFGIRLRAHL